MVHRDIKPGNILVQKHGQSGLIKISDFGLARLAAPAPCHHPGMDAAPMTIFTRDNAVMGTPDYLSPEQSRDLHQTDIRSDLYSLGCTFYYLLTREVPYPGGTALEKLIRHATEPPCPVEQFRDDVPAEVHAILKKLIAKQPADRYQTPAELMVALEPFAVTGPTPWTKPRLVPDAAYMEAISTPEGYIDGVAATPSDWDEVGSAPLTKDGASLPSDPDVQALTPTLMTSPTDTPTSLASLMKKARERKKSSVGFAVILSVVLAVGFLSVLLLIALLASGR
jgi:serine/threonine protein kinase